MAAPDTKNPKQEDKQLGHAPDLTQRGWPSISDKPSVERDYYEQFDPRVRPRFSAGGGTSSLMTSQQAEMLKAAGSVFRMVTVFNFSMRDLILTIPGGQLGTALQVLLPPLGVIRAPEAALPLHQSVEGSKFETVRLASPQGDCRRARRIKDGMIEYESCDFVACPHHPIPDPHQDSPRDRPHIYAHAVIEAQRLLSSIGAPLTETYVDGEGKSKTRIAFTPPVDVSMRECLLVTKLDARGPVAIGVQARISFLQQREAKFNAITSKGGQAAGR